MDNNNIKLSIIIPAYNVESYIGKCIESCLNQDIPHEDYEIIVIDDGSKDNTGQVVKDFAKKWQNIRYQYQENAGQAAARNVGIDLARGEYIWFVDSDDWIRENCLSSLISYAEGSRLDLCLFPTNMVSDNNEYIEDEFSFIGDQIYSLVSFAQKGKLIYTPWIYIIRSELINLHNLYFISGIYHEDTEFSTRLIQFTQRIGHFDKLGGLYYYRYTRSDSTMNNPTKAHIEKRIYSLFEILSAIKNTYNESQDELYREYLAYWHNTIFKSWLIPLYSNLPQKEAKHTYNAYMDKYDFDYLSNGKLLSSNTLLSRVRHSLPLTRTALFLLDKIFLMNNR